MLITSPRLLAALLLLVAIAAPAQATTLRPHRYLAVMPFDARGAEINDAARRVLEETVRTEAGNLLSGLGFVIFTSDNTLQLLADNGIDPEKACDASCSLEVAREITADYFVTGTLTSLEQELVLFIRLLDTKTAQQLGSLHLDSKTVNGLRTNLVKESGSLFVTLRNQSLVRKAHAGKAKEEQLTAVRDSLEFSVEEKEIVQFESTPSKAIVRLNETILCQETPCSRSVPLGQHLVTMEFERHLPATKLITVVKDSRRALTVNLTLSPTFGTLAIATRPEGVIVSIDNKQKKKAPLSLDLDPGVYELKIADPCYLPDGQRVVVKAGDKRTLKLKASKKEVGLSVEAVSTSQNALKARIEVDGQGYGTTPKNLKIPLCSTNLRVVAPDGRIWDKKLKLKENKVEHLLATFSLGPKIEKKRGIPTWAYWVGGIGAATWLGAGVGAIGVREEIRTLPPGHADIESGITTGNALIIVSNIGAAAVLSAAVGGIVGLATK